MKSESAIARCKEEADKMFFDVLGRKDKADKTRNALNVLNRYRKLVQLGTGRYLPLGPKTFCFFS